LNSVKGGSNYCGTNPTDACAGPTTENCPGTGFGTPGGSGNTAYGCAASNCGNGATNPIHCTSSHDVGCEIWIDFG